jgi:hypothetical protein
MISRSASPSAKVTPAASDAMTVEKALMVQPRTPTPAPSRITATAVSASNLAAIITGMSRT